MKRLTKRNICVSSWCQVVAVSILFSQIIQLVGAQNSQVNSIDPNDQLELTINTSERQNRALNSSEEDGCPMCNLSEVSSWRHFCDSENFLNNLRTHSCVSVRDFSLKNVIFFIFL